MSATQLPTGSLFGGDFEISRKLGEGGMGAVYLAHQRSTNLMRALKIMHPELLRDPVLRARFTQEATIGSLIRSEHVVKVVVAGVDVATQIPFMVMEFLEGEDLATRLERRGALPLQEARVLFMQLCHGLAMAHAVGIVHRDLKPENVFVARSGRADVADTVKILDFGIAKLVAEARGTSQGTQALGTPWFMAPEQAQSGIVPTAAADVWALGLVAFSVLTNRSYWRSSVVRPVSIHSVLAEVLQSPIVPASQRLAELGAPNVLPRGFDEWFARCVNRDVNARFREAGEAWTALAWVIDAALMGSAGAGYAAVGVQGGYTPTPRQQGYVSAHTAPGMTPAQPIHPSYPQVPPANTPPGTTPGRPAWVPEGAIPVGPSGPVAIDRGVRTGPVSSQKGKGGGLWIALLVLGGVALVGGGTAYGLWARTSTTYCATETVTKNGRPLCVAEISADVVAHRQRSVRLTRSRGRITREEFVNAYGKPASSDGGVISWTYEYSGGEVRLSTARGSHGQVLFKLRYAEGGKKFEVLGPDDQLRAYPGTRVAKAEKEVDSRGFETKVRFFSRGGNPATNASNAFGYNRTYDDRGRVTEEVVVGPDGNPWVDKDGQQRTVLTYDERGEIEDLTITTSDGKPHLHNDGYHRYAVTRDANGNATKFTYFGLDGKPTVVNAGFASSTTRFDEHGFGIEIRYLGPDGSPARDSSGRPVMRFAFDEDGNAKEVRYLDSEGSPILSNNNYAGFQATRDAGGDELRTTYLGIDGKPAPSQDHCTFVEQTRDERGNSTEWRCLDETNKPTWTGSGYATRRTTYNENDNPTEIRYFDPSGKPTLPSAGYAIVRYQYDESGNAVQESYFDVNEKPVRTTSWVASIKRRFDDRGNALEIAYLDPAGNPTRHKSGYAIERVTYSDRNLVTERAYLNPEGKPTWSKFGASVLRWKYDAFGREIEESNHDTEGRLTPNKSGQVTERTQYDERGRIVETSYFDAWGKPTMNRAEGWASKRTTYDVLGHAIEKAFFGPAGTPVVGSSGYAIQRLEYDERGRAIVERYYDAGGAPTASSEGYAMVRAKRDPFGRTAEVAYFDREGHPTKLKSGYATVRYQNDRYGNTTEWAYFDELGNPVSSNGCYVQRATHDHLGHRTELACLDAQQRPAPFKSDGTYATRYAFDPKGRVTEEANFDGNGMPMKDSSGISKVAKTYDERGNEIERLMLDEKGGRARGYLAAQSTYDDRGNVTRFALFDDSGKPAMNRYDVSVEVTTWNERDQQVETAYFDVKNKPTISKRTNAAIVRTTYDEHGEKRDTQYLDASGQPIKTPAGRR